MFLSDTTHSFIVKDEIETQFLSGKSVRNKKWSKRNQKRNAKEFLRFMRNFQIILSRLKRKITKRLSPIWNVSENIFMQIIWNISVMLEIVSKEKLK